MFVVAILDPHGVSLNALVELANNFGRCWGDLIGFSILQTGMTLVASGHIQDGLGSSSGFQHLNKCNGRRMAKISVEALNCTHSFGFVISHELDDLPMDGFLLIDGESSVPCSWNFRSSKA